MADKIESLTPEQIEAMHKYRDEFMQIGLATGEVDIKVCAPVITEFYKRVNRPAPLIWVAQSPFMVQLLANIWNTVADITIPDHEALMSSPLVPMVRLVKQSYTEAVVENMLYNLIRGAHEGRWTGSTIKKSVEQYAEELRARINATMAGKSLVYHYTPFWGSLDSYWIAYYLFPHLFVKPIHTDDQVYLLRCWETVARNSGWWYPYDGVCFMCHRSEWIKLDERNRLSYTDGAAIKYPDGWGAYCVNGVMMPEDVIEDHALITPERINVETNQEVKRIMIDIIGAEEYLRRSKAVKRDESEDGILWVCPVSGDEDIVMVEVINSTPNPDGTFKHYFLRVPPATKTAREARAYTFGITDPNLFDPKVET